LRDLHGHYLTMSGSGVVSLLPRRVTESAAASQKWQIHSTAEAAAPTAAGAAVPLPQHALRAGNGMYMALGAQGGEMCGTSDAGTAAQFIVVWPQPDQPLPHSVSSAALPQQQPQQ
jgi:hypothetical protein